MNERLPALTARNVIRALERAGFVVSRTSGSHCRLIHATDPVRKVTVPVHSGDLERGTLRAIIAQAGMTVAEFLAFLQELGSWPQSIRPNQVAIILTNVSFSNIVSESKIALRDAVR